MKKTVLIFLFLAVVLEGAAQSKKAKDFYVSSFKALPMDLDARTIRPEVDQNGKKAALIKLVTTQDGFDFDVGITCTAKSAFASSECICTGSLFHLAFAAAFLTWTTSL